MKPKTILKRVAGASLLIMAISNIYHLISIDVIEFVLSIVKGGFAAFCTCISIYSIHWLLTSE